MLKFQTQVVDFQEKFVSQWDKYLILLFIPFATGLLTGCSTYSNLQADHFQTVPGRKDARVFIATPEDGKFQDKCYPGSGRLTAVALMVEARKYFDHVELGGMPKSRGKNIKDAKAAECTLMFEPTILHWEDRATGWSGRPDRVEVELQTVDVATGKVLNTAILRNSSSYFAPPGQQPYDLLTKPFQEYFGTKSELITARSPKNL